jgi:hypothetical protein
MLQGALPLPGRWHLERDPPRQSERESSFNQPAYEVGCHEQGDEYETVWSNGIGDISPHDRVLQREGVEVSKLLRVLCAILSKT